MQTYPTDGKHVHRNVYVFFHMYSHWEQRTSKIYESLKIVLISQLRNVFTSQRKRISSFNLTLN